MGRICGGLELDVGVDVGRVRRVRVVYVVGYLFERGRLGVFLGWGGVAVFVKWRQWGCVSAVGGRCPVCTFYVTLIALTTYSNSGGARGGATRGKIRVMLPSVGGRISIVALGGRSFRRRLMDGKGIATGRRTGLHFRDDRIVTRVCIGGKSQIQGKRGLTRLSGFGLTGELTRSTSTLRETQLRLRSMLVKRKCTARSFDGIPRRIVGLTGMGDKCSRDGTRCRLMEERRRRTALATPFSKMITGLFTGPCGVTGASRVFYAVVSARKVRTSFAILRDRLPLLGGNSEMIMAPCTSTASICRKDISRVGPLMSSGKVIEMQTQIGKGKGLFDKVGMQVDMRHSLKRLLIVPGDTIMLHSKGRIIFALSGKGTR